MIGLYIIITILTGGVIGIWVMLWKIYNNKNNIQSPTPNSKEDNLAKIVEMMKEEKDEKEREKRDKELIDYAIKKRKEMPTGGIRKSGQEMLEETPINANTHDLIPYGLSQMERDILEEFYRR